MDITDDFKNILKIVTDSKELGYKEYKKAFEIIMSGKATDAQISSFLTAIKMQEHNPTVIAAGAEILREKCLRISSKENTVDVVGTGGDNLGTLNISTAVSFVLSGTGVSVAKHGNYAASSKSGAANVVKALSVNIDCEINAVSKCLEEIGICFLFAPKHHTAMKYVGKIRQELGIRTIFNLLGPLTNPASAKNQVVGVYSKELTIVFAEVLKKLGSHHVLSVHGADGMDEISITGKTYIAELKNGKISEYEFNPQDYGFKLGRIEDIEVTNIESSKKMMLGILNGDKNTARNITIINAGAALYVSGICKDFRSAFEVSAQMIDEGLALKKLKQLIKKSNE